jgi:hypothetical protein
LKKEGVRASTEFSCFIGGNEATGAIKDGKFLDQLSSYQILKKNSTPLS